MSLCLYANSVYYIISNICFQSHLHRNGFPHLFIKYTIERGRETYILINLFPDNYAKIIGEMQLCDVALINILHTYMYIYI